MWKKSLAVVAILAMVSGCAAMRAARARQDSLRASMSNLSLAAPPDQVLNAVRVVLVERGFAPKDVGLGVVETDWKYSSSSNNTGSSSESWKYVVTAIQLGEGTKLTVMKNSQASQASTTGYASSPTSARDYELELEVLRKVDPATADKIESDAAANAEAARNS